jgi:hypothetical protein
MLENIPLDLKIELGKLIHVEKFSCVKKELLDSTLYISGYIQLVECSYFQRTRKSLIIRPVYFKSSTCQTTRYILQRGLISQTGVFVWALCDQPGDVVDNDFSIAGKNHKTIKEYLLKNESCK